MKLEEALELDRRKRAKAVVPLGYVYAMGTAMGDGIFVQFCKRGDKPQLRNYRLLSKMDIVMQRFYLIADWQPVDPIAPLEALARQGVTDGEESEGS